MSLLGLQATEAQRSRNAQPGANDRVVDHHYGHRRPRDYVQFVAVALSFSFDSQVQSRVLFSDGLNLGVRDADEHYRFGVLDEADPGDDRITVHTHKHVYGLARIARSRHKVRGEKHIAKRALGTQSLYDGKVVAHFAISLGTRNQLMRRYRVKET
jgi:hypothetical protein